MADPNELEIRIVGEQTSAAGGPSATPSSGSFQANELSATAGVAGRFATMFGPSWLAATVGRLESARRVFDDISRLAERTAKRQAEAAAAETKRVEAIEKAASASRVAPQPGVADRLGRLDDLRSRRGLLQGQLSKIPIGADPGFDKYLETVSGEAREVDDEIAELLKSLPKALQQRVKDADRLANLESQASALRKQLDATIREIEGGSPSQPIEKLVADGDRLAGLVGKADEEIEAIRATGVRSRLTAAGGRSAASVSAGRTASAAAARTAAGAAAGAGGAGGVAAGGGAAGAGAAGGAAGLAALAAPVAAVAAVAGVAAVAIGAMVYATNRVVDAMTEYADRLVDLNADVASASASRDVARLVGDIRRGEVLGDDVARFIRLQSRSEQAIEDLKATVTLFFYKVLEPMLEVGVGALGVIGDAARSIQSSVDKVDVKTAYQEGFVGAMAAAGIPAPLARRVLSLLEKALDKFDNADEADGEMKKMLDDFFRLDVPIGGWPGRPQDQPLPAGQAPLPPLGGGFGGF